MRADYSDWHESTCNIGNITQQVDICYRECTLDTKCNEEYNCTYCYYTIVLYWNSKTYKIADRSNSCPIDGKCNFNEDNIYDTLTLADIIDEDRNVMILGGVVLFLLAICIAPCSVYASYKLYKSRHVSIFPKDSSSV